MNNLIINSDDFGLTSNIDKGIIELIDLNVVNAVSIMSTGLNISKSIKYLKTVDKKIYKGVHLDLITGNLFNVKRYKSVEQILFSIIKNKNNLKKIYIEFEKQILFLLKNNIKLNFINSHKHIHFIPQLYKMTLYLSKKYNIKYIRYPVPELTLEELKYLFYRKDFYKFFLFYFFKFFNKNINKQTKFLGLFQSGNLNEKYLRYVSELTKTNKKINYEFMVHPGYKDESLENLNDNFNENRYKELLLLKNKFIS